MKTSYLIASGLTAVLLTGCIKDPAGIHNTNVDNYILNSEGGWALDCVTNRPLGSDGDYFWDYNNLPHGTVDYVCKEGRAYLPGQAPNCDMQDGFCPPDKDTKKCFSDDLGSYYYSKECNQNSGDRVDGYWDGDKWMNRVYNGGDVYYVEGKWFGL
ncbi:MULTISPECIES: hypothetical protein [unclassified Psychrobacter]|uniref:hypothetical protein n=1 Tax=unclassified Psychrobacter TaxID=196806 RepID=UPI003F998B6D